MKKIALYGVFNPDILRALHENVPEGFKLVDIPNPEDLQSLSDAEYMLNRGHYVTKEVIDASHQMKMIAKWGVGVEKLDIEYAAKKHIPVVPCVGVNAAPVSELAVLLMLAVYRIFLPVHEALREGNWQARDEFSRRSYLIRGKMVGLLGCGNIGQRVAHIVKDGFGAQVQYYDVARMAKETEDELGLQYVDLDTLFQTSDIISLHLPLLESTRSLVNARRFAQMKKTAVLINTSRGGVVDENALLTALNNDQIMGAGLDTFALEPVTADHPLLSHPRVVATPHFGGNTCDNDINMIHKCYDNIVKYNSGIELPPNYIANFKYL